MAELEIKESVPKQFVVDGETAEVEFQRFLDGMEIDMELLLLDENERTSVQIDKARIVKGIKDGRITVNENGIITLIPRDGSKPFVFHEPKGSCLVAMDSRKKNHEVAKIYASLGDITRQPAVRFTKLKYNDVKDIMAVFNFFTA